MDLAVMLTTFTTLFLAELGDKTQLAVLSLVASTRRPLSVFVGGAAALLAVTAIGVLFGQGLTRVVPESLLRRTAAAAFIIVGLVLFLRAD
ncbi:MAG TPA: TMEM165/GDT1 family protein [bacterium]